MSDVFVFAGILPMALQITSHYRIVEHQTCPHLKASEDIDHRSTSDPEVSNPGEQTSLWLRSLTPMTIETTQNVPAVLYRQI